MAPIPKLERRYRQATLKDVNDSKTWVLKKMSYLKSATAHGLMSFAKELKSSIDIGQMAFYFYDAKWKDELPYWDYFPLVIPIKHYDDGLLGINLHYLPPRQRAILLDRLMDFANNDKMNSSTRIKASYELLNDISRYEMFKPCLHRYLYSHMKSKFLIVDPSDWHLAIMLPVQDFRKGGTGKHAGKTHWARRVWNNSGKPQHPGYVKSGAGSHVKSGAGSHVKSGDGKK